MLLYCLSAAVFSELLRKLCRTQARLGAAIPVLMAVMLALCPIFLDLKVLTPVRHLLPDPGVVLVRHGVVRLVPEISVRQVAPACQAQMALGKRQALPADDAVPRQDQVRGRRGKISQGRTGDRLVHSETPLSPGKNQQLIAPQQWMT